MRASLLRRFLLSVILLSLLLLVEVPTVAGPPAQEDDPCAECAEGVQLFLDGRHAEALPLLEAGFTGRKDATCASSDEMGTCALALGFIREGTGDKNSALDAYAVALEIFRSNGNRVFEWITLDLQWAAMYDELDRFEAVQEQIANVHLRGR